ncbi:extracellular solute-binding protein [Williamsia sp. CHRR-6]|nr:extracellular solute-binding protein [Williamsia sp. CHRR-6]
MAACGSSGGGSKTINVYAPADGAEPLAAAGKVCSDSSNGDYTISIKELPKNADDQRTQLARRLSTKDKGIDVVSLDVVWTAEFADAGWIAPVPDALSKTAQASSLPGPLASAEWKTKSDSAKRLYAVPAWTNTQLLWYRKDVLKKYLGANATPPKTWDQLLKDNETIRKAWTGPGKAPSYIMVQAKQYEGLTVWFNTLLASAGGSVIDPNDPTKVTLGDTPEHKAATEKALAIIAAIGKAPGAAPDLNLADEGAAKDAGENGTSTFQLNYPFVFPSMRSNAATGDVKFLTDVKAKYGKLFADPNNPPKDAELGPVNELVRQKFDFAPYPSVVAGDPAKVTVGGINFGVAAYSTKKDKAFKAVECLTNKASQKVYAISGGTPPTDASIYDDPEFKQTYPMGDLIKAQLEADSSAVRPTSPVYQAISTALSTALNPPGKAVGAKGVDDLTAVVQKALDSGKSGS